MRTPQQPPSQPAPIELTASELAQLIYDNYKIARKYRKTLAIASDFDGTLEETDSTVDVTTISDEMLAVLNFIREQDGLFFATITGRNIEQAFQAVRSRKGDLFAFDGGAYVDKDGKITRKPMPKVSEFWALVANIKAEMGDEVKLLMELDDAPAIAFRDTPTGFAAWEKHWKEFERLKAARTDINLYRHRNKGKKGEPDSLEIIVQGPYTKGTACDEMVELLGGADQCVPIALGNSSNDLPLFRKVNELGGVSICVGIEYAGECTYWVKDVGVIQQGLKYFAEMISQEAV